MEEVVIAITAASYSGNKGAAAMLQSSIRQLYEKWCSLESLKYKTYTQKENELPPLVDNKVFQPVRNMIIRTVLDMNYPVIDVEIEEPDPTEQFENDDFYVDISPQFDESEQSENDNIIFHNNLFYPLLKTFRIL